MTTTIFSVFGFLALFFSSFKEQTFVGSTPAHPEVKNFLGIPIADSIDFIRWKLETKGSSYKLECKYGISKPGTSGFINEKVASFEGELISRDNHFYLRHDQKKLGLLNVNRNLLHLVDQNGQMLAGNGGYSYALNNIYPELSDQFNLKSVNRSGRQPEVYEGRTPCQELSALLGLHKGDACNKMKWYIIFFSDSLTGRPTYYLSGGRAYRKETMDKGTWKTTTGSDGRIIYEVYSDKYEHPIHLVKGNDNILFFTDAAGRLLVGNSDFSYTLNRRKEEMNRQ